MLWACLHFPALALNLVEQHLPPEQPVIIEITHRQRRRVWLANAAARAAGIQPDMTVPTAQSLVKGLHCAERDTDAEQAALIAIGHWAYQFTPYLHRHGDNNLLLEVSQSLTLFGGKDALAQRMQSLLPDTFRPVNLAFCDTALAALLFAQTHASTASALFFTLDQLNEEPIDGLDIDDALKRVLHSVGITTLAQLLALPRDALAKRFGPALVHYLRQLTGETPDLLPTWKLPDHFQAQLDFPHELENSAQLLFPLRHLLTRLEHYLRARQAATTCLQFAMPLRNRQLQHWALRLAAPHYRSTDMIPLLQLQLERLQLQAPALGVQLQVNEFVPLPGGQQDLLTPWRSDQVSRQQLVDRLQARLGQDNVCGLGMVADHRPEFSWTPTPPGTPAGQGKTVEHPTEQRPFWLLEQPQKLRDKKGLPVYGDPLQLLKGPERIETGWWDNRPVNRDYFVARRGNGQRLWIYRDRTNQQWYLHGIF